MSKLAWQQKKSSWWLSAEPGCWRSGTCEMALQKANRYAVAEQGCSASVACCIVNGSVGPHSSVIYLCLFQITVALRTRCSSTVVYIRLSSCHRISGSAKFFPPPKIRRKNYGRCKRRRICKSGEPPQKLRLTFGWVYHFTEPKTVYFAYWLQAINLGFQNVSTQR